MAALVNCLITALVKASYCLIQLEAFHMYPLNSIHVNKFTAKELIDTASLRERRNIECMQLQSKEILYAYLLNSFQKLRFCWLGCLLAPIAYTNTLTQKKMCCLLSVLQGTVRSHSTAHERFGQLALNTNYLESLYLLIKSTYSAMIYQVPISVDPRG